MYSKEQKKYYYDLLSKEEKRDLEEKISHLKESFETTDGNSYIREKEEFIEAYNEVFETCYKLENEIALKLGGEKFSPEFNTIYAGLADSLEGSVYESIGVSSGLNCELNEKLNEFEHDVLMEEANSLGL